MPAPLAAAFTPRAFFFFEIFRATPPLMPCFFACLLCLPRHTLDTLTPYLLPILRRLHGCYAIFRVAAAAGCAAERTTRGAAYVTTTSLLAADITLTMPVWSFHAIARYRRLHVAC